MGEKMPPDWAIEKVLSQVNPLGHPDASKWTLDEIKTTGNGIRYAALTLAFARYIAEHEDEPVDPFEAAFDDLYNDGSLRNNADMIRAALKRGMELASNNQGGA